MQNDNQKPVHKIQAGPLSAAIWERKSDDGIFYTATVQKWYRKDGKDQYTGSFGRSDLLEAAKLLDLAHTWILKLEREDRAKGKPE